MTDYSSDISETASSPEPFAIACTYHRKLSSISLPMQLRLQKYFMGHQALP